MPVIFLDIETIPDPCESLFGLGLLADDLSDEQSAVLKQSLHPLRGRLACITLAAGADLPYTIEAWDGDTEPPRTVEAWDAIEVRMLTEMRVYLGEAGVTSKDLGLVVGHNVSGFDLPWLMVRCMRYRHPLRRWVPWPIIGGKPWEGGVERIRDTQIWSRGPNRAGHPMRCTELCAYLGLVGEDEDQGDGSDVLRFWLSDQRHLITEHCEADVRRVQALYQQITGVAL